MTWFKVDDGLHAHPKWRAASKGARALWATAGSWSADQLTDGFVPRHMLAMLEGTTKEAAELVDVGLWEVAEGGWTFHQWNEEGRQPTREQVERERTLAAERQRRARDKARESRRDGAVTDAQPTPRVTVPPTRPVPKGTPQAPRDAIRPPLPDAADVMAEKMPAANEVAPMPEYLRRRSAS